jgi:hypothetical protein
MLDVNPILMWMPHRPAWRLLGRQHTGILRLAVIDEDETGSDQVAVRVPKPIC